MLQTLLLTETATQDLVTINWTFIAQICNLFIQVFLIKKFLFKPVREILAKRQAKADADIREAKEAKDEAAAIKAEYEQNMLEAKEKANELLATAQKNATAKSDEYDAHSDVGPQHGHDAYESTDEERSQGDDLFDYFQAEEQVAAPLHLQHVQVDGMQRIERTGNANERKVS